MTLVEKYISIGVMSTIMWYPIGLFIILKFDKSLSDYTQSAIVFFPPVIIGTLFIIFSLILFSK